MRCSNRTITVFALLAATTSAQAAPCDSLDPARWLVGQWAAESGDRIFIETWREASAATFEGSGVTTARSDGAVLDSEELRLFAMADAVFYVAKVTHNPYPVSDGAERGFKLQFRGRDRP